MTANRWLILIWSKTLEIKPCWILCTMEVFATPFVQNKPTGLSPTSVAEYPFLHTQVCLLAIFLVLLFSNFFVLFLCTWRQEQPSFHRHLCHPKLYKYSQYRQRRGMCPRVVSLDAGNEHIRIILLMLPL